MVEKKNMVINLKNQPKKSPADTAPGHTPPLILSFDLKEFKCYVLFEIKINYKIVYAKKNLSAE